MPCVYVSCDSDSFFCLMECMCLITMHNYCVVPDTPNVKVAPIYLNDGMLTELFVEFSDQPVS